MRAGWRTVLLALVTAWPWAAGAIEPMGQGAPLAPLDPALATAPDAVGLNPFHPDSRTPTGRLYPLVRQPQTSETEGGWRLQYALELGAVATAGDERVGRYREYFDSDDGALLGRFLLNASGPDSQRYWRIAGAALGRDDGYFRLDTGRRGRFNLGLWHSETPHVFTNNARVLWDGAGSGRLTLPASLQRPATPDAVRALLAGREPAELALSRKRWGLGFDLKPRPALKLYGHADLEQRRGSRPFGATMGFPGNGQFSEIIEPLDHRTVRFDLGMQWAARRQQLNAHFGASNFRNDIAALRYENPALSPFPFFAPPAGQLSLAPDNDYRNLKLDYARSFEWWRSRLTVSGARSRFDQNEALLPPTISSGVVTDGDRVDLDLWNSVAALSRANAGARRDQSLLRLKWVARPTRRLRLVLEHRDESRDNDTRYTAFNPLTGELGTVVLDGALLSIPGQGGIYRPEVPGSRVRIASIPFSRDRDRTAVTGEFRLSTTTRLSLAYEQEQARHQFRERTRVDDDKVRAQLTWRGVGTLRAALETTRREGDRYRFNPYEPFFSSSLPGFVGEFDDFGGTSPVTLSSLRKYDLASFDRDRAQLKWHVPLGQSMDLNLSGHWQQTGYEARHGLTDSQERSLNADWSLRLGRGHSLYAWASSLSGDRGSAGIRANGSNTAAFGVDPDPGGINFPLSNGWSERVDDRHRSMGFGWQREFERLSLRLDYSRTESESRIGYGYASASALVRRIDPEVAGRGFPRLDLDYQRFEASARWQLRPGLALRLLYRFESEDLRDFHYLGLLDPVVEEFGAGDVYLAAGPRDYDAGLLAFLVELGPRRD